MISTLTKLGLTPHEASVYVAALQLGQTTALAISRKTGIKRGTVYDTLDTLTKRGLIELRLKGLKRYFAPTSPDQFDKIISEQKAEYEHVLPDMLALYHLQGEHSQIQVREGVEGVKSAIEDVLRETPTGAFWYVIDDQQNWERHLELSWLERLIERRARRQFDFRIMFPDSERGRFNKQMEQAWNQKVRLLPHSVHADVTIAPGHYIIHNFTAPITTIIIRTPEVIETQKNLFLALWDSLPE